MFVALRATSILWLEKFGSLVSLKRQHRPLTTMSLSKITLRDRTIESSYVEGNIGNHIFRIRTSKVRRDVIEFRFT